LNLQGTKSNRNVAGARVELKAGGLTQVDEIQAGDNDISHSDWRLHFGLGAAMTVDEITVRWPGGAVENLPK